MPTASMRKAKGMVTMVRNDAIALLLLCALSSFPPAQASASDVVGWEPEPTASSLSLKSHAVQRDALLRCRRRTSGTAALAQ